MPCVLTRAEVRSILGRMRGVERLVAGLLYGSGLRLLEALHLRIKDVDFERHEIMVRRGKGAKDRITVLADAQRLPLARYLDALRDRFRRTRTTVELPDALKKKCPNADREWCWQWVFPGRGRPLSLASYSGPACVPCGCPSKWDYKASVVPQSAPLVCDPFARRGI